MQYHRKAVSGVNAWHYHGQHHTELPDWLRSFSVWLDSKTDAITGVHYKGRLLPVRQGDWIVLEDGALGVMAHADFVATYGAGVAS